MNPPEEPRQLNGMSHFAISTPEFEASQSVNGICHGNSSALLMFLCYSLSGKVSPSVSMVFLSIVCYIDFYSRRGAAAVTRSRKTQGQVTEIKI
jgi:hypothetical protein